MKRYSTLILALASASLLLAATPASADGRRHGPPGHYSHHHHHSNRALAWGVAGLTAGALLFSWQSSPPPVVVAPMTPIAPMPPPGRMWYYCDAYGAYYPYVAQCPGGWRAVPAY